MRVITLTIAMMLLSQLLFAQNIIEECSTIPYDTTEVKKLPWYGKNEFLTKYKEKKDKEKKEKEEKEKNKDEQGQNLFRDQSLQVTTASTCSPYDYLVPVKIIVWHNGDHNEFMTPALAEDILAEANRRYREAGASIQFYLVRSPDFKENNAYASGIETDAEQAGMFSLYYNSQQITIHFTGGFEGSYGSASLPGVAYVRSNYVRTDGFLGNIFTVGSQEYIESVGGTLAHELGHNLGLSHTHAVARLLYTDDNGSVSNGCYQEAVSRTARNRWYDGCTSTDNYVKCQVNGDQLCDTPADPNLNRVGYNDNPHSTTSPCSITLPDAGDYSTDNWGDTWNPNARNVMAYNNRRCRNFFSQGQITIMHYILDTYWSGRRNNISLTSSAERICYNQTATISLPSVFGDGYSDIYGARPYEWKVGPGLTITSGQGTKSITVRGSSSSMSGYVDVNVTISSPTGTFCVNRKIYLGTPPRPSSIYGSTNVCAGGLVNYSCSPSAYATSYQWSLDANSAGWSIESQNGTSATFRAGYGSTYVRVTAKNACGASSMKYVYVSVDQSCGGGGCGPYLQASPNPSNGEISVSVVAPVEPCYSSTNIQEAPLSSAGYDVFLYDESGNVVHKDHKKEKNFIINKRGIKKGFYILKVNTKDISMTQRLLIE